MFRCSFCGEEKETWYSDIRGGKVSCAACRPISKKTNGMLGKKHTQEALDKISSASRKRKGWNHSEKARRKMSETRKKLIAEGKIVTPFMTEDKTGKNNPRLRDGQKQSMYVTGHFFSSKMNEWIYFQSSLEYIALCMMEDNTSISSFKRLTNRGKNSLRIPLPTGSYYVPDYKVEFIYGDIKIIEVKPKRLINTEQNKIKFDAAYKMFGGNFEVWTERECYWQSGEFEEPSARNGGGNHEPSLLNIA
jgi:hypothetical protein